MEPVNQLGLEVSTERESFGVVGLELRAFLCKDDIDIAKVPSRIMIVFLIFAADLESAMPCYV